MAISCLYKFVCAVILSFHLSNGTKMTDKNQRPEESPDSSDFTNQWPSELSEYFKFDDDQWLGDDPESFASEHVSNQVYHATEVGGSSHFEGSSSSKLSF